MTGSEYFKAHCVTGVFASPPLSMFDQCRSDAFAAVFAVGDEHPELSDSTTQKVDVHRSNQYPVNLRQDPCERTPSTQRQSLNDQGAAYFNDFMGRELWRFVYVQQKVLELAETAIEYPPMQAPASFNLEAVKREIDEKIKTAMGK